MQKLKTKIFLDSANPEDTKEAIKLLGFLDGQTTNPSLFAKLQNKKYSENELWEEYIETLKEIRKINPKGSLSAEIYADSGTTCQQMVSQAKKLLDSDQDLHIKLPTSINGVKALRELIKTNKQINMTLGFDTHQAYAVARSAQNTKKGQVYYSSFVGRLFDNGINGIEVVNHVQNLFEELNTPVSLLACSFRTLDQFLACLALEVDIVTVNLELLKQWKAHNFEIPKFSSFSFIGRAPNMVPVVELDEDNLNNNLLLKGLTKFADDWNSLLK
ncbi:MAG: transaldolase family protein [Patescibacteria group bacterium]